MKVRGITLSTLAVGVLTLAAFVASNEQSDSRYSPRKSGFIQDVGRIDGAREFMKSIRANQVTGDIDFADVAQARKDVEKLALSGKAVNLNWEFMGPDNIGGRTRAVLIDRNDPNHLIVGGVSGGLYESFNAAGGWQPYDPDFKIANVSSIAQAIDGEIYVGTGALHDGQGNFKSLSSFFIGTGLYRLTGNGQSELLVGPTADNTFNVEWAGINSIATHPTDANTIYVAMDRGLRVSTDRGATWTNPVLSNGTSGNPVTQECLHVVIGSNGRVVAAYNGGLIYSSPTGDVGTHTLSTITSTSVSGNPGRTELAIAPSDPNIVYASTAIAGSNCLFGINRSRDGGVTWEEIGPGGSPTFDMFSNPGVNCQGDYDNAIAVYPNNPGRIIVGGVNLFRWEQSSVDPAPANGSWEAIAVTNRFVQNGLYVHADKHAITFLDSNTVYLGTDGGIAKSTSIGAAQPFFTEQNFNYGITQFYDIGAGPQGVIIGGTQDNGSLAVGVQFNTGKAGFPVRGGDGFGSEMSNINHTIGFASLYFGDVQRVQGIGTTLGSTNISLAGFYNDRMDAFCNTGRCSPVFYTCTRLWESFNHLETSDSVIVPFVDAAEIIPAGRSFNYESKNNQYPLSDVSTVDYRAISGNVNSSTDTSIALSVRSSSSAKKMDTLYQHLTTTNYKDTLLIDAVAGTITIRGAINTVIDFRDDNRNEDSIIFNDTLTEFYFNGMTNDTLRVTGRVSGGDSLITMFFKDYTFADFNFEAKLPDFVQSMVTVNNFPGPSNNNERNVWMTRDALKTQPSLVWYKIAGYNSRPDRIPRTTDPGGGNIIVNEFSRDGNHLFLGTTGGRVYRISGLNNAVDFATANIDNTTHIQTCRLIANFSGRAVTGIAIDPNNDDHMIVTVGNYSNINYVYRTTTATTAVDPATAFQTIQGDLPRMPVYDAVIDKNDGDKVLIATEFGVYATEAAFSTTDPSQVSWVEENAGLGRFPTYAIEQQIFSAGEGVTNDGMIYAGTHGRGAFRTGTLVGIDELGRNNDDNFRKVLKSTLKVYPNPMVDRTTVSFQLPEAAEITVRVFDLRGQLVRELNLNRRSAGKVEIPLELGSLSANTYLMQVQADQISTTTKFIVSR